MADSRRIHGEQVKCHECMNTWPREQGGLQCPGCDSEFVEILSDSNPPSPELPPRPENVDGIHLTRSRSLDSLENHNPWRDAPDPDEDDIHGFPFGGGGGPSPQPRSYHYETRSPNGGSSFSFSMVSTNGGPMRVSTSRGRGSGQFGDPALMEVQQDLGDLVQSIMGLRPQQQRPGQRRGPMPRGPPVPAFPFGPIGPQQEQGQAPEGGPMSFFGSLFGLGGGRFQAGGGDMNDDPFAALRRLMDPANAAHGDAVFSQEAFDRVITQLMEQNQAGSAPGPASETAIRSLPKKKVQKDMLDEKGKAECSICMDNVEVGDQVTVLPCTHWFHEPCITAWLKEHDTCPHCRKGISPPPEAKGSAARGGGQPSRPPRRRSSAAMPGSWRGSGGTSRNPVSLADDTSPGPHDVRAARDRYYGDQSMEDLERRDTQARRSSRSIPSSPPSAQRRQRSESHRSNSHGRGGGQGNGHGGGFPGWVRSFGGN